MPLTALVTSGSDFSNNDGGAVANDLQPKRREQIRGVESAPRLLCRVV